MERRELNRGYEPGNCVWADATTQIRNRRVTKEIDSLCRDIHALVLDGMSITRASITVVAGADRCPENMARMYRLRRRNPEWLAELAPSAQECLPLDGSAR